MTSDSDKPKQRTGETVAGDERRAREAAALRANLARRKQQQRGRRDGGPASAQPLAGKAEEEGGDA